MKIVISSISRILTDTLSASVEFNPQPATSPKQLIHLTKTDLKKRVKEVFLYKYFREMQPRFLEYEPIH